MSDEIVFDVLCTKVLDALRALGLGKFSIRNYYYEGMWPIIKVYRSEGVILYSAAFTNEIVDRFRLEHENGLVADRIWAKVRKAAALFEEYVQTGKIVWKRVRPAPKIPLTPYYQELLCSFCQHEANTRAIGFESLIDCLQSISSNLSKTPLKCFKSFCFFRVWTTTYGLLFRMSFSRLT